MSFLNILKKKKVPDELPDLATDKIEEKLDNEKLEEHKNAVNDFLKNEESPPKRIEHSSIQETAVAPQANVTPPNPPKENLPERKTLVDDKGYFDDLEDNLTKEIGDLDKLESWYKNKFLARDVVSDMKNYWENQKNSSVIKILGRNFKDRISEKTNKLQGLEKDWQNIYFDLIEKEEEIREQERELKKLLSEFVEVCKRREKSESDRNRIQKIM